MTIRGRVAISVRRALCRPARRGAATVFRRLLVCALATATLAGCGGGVGSLLVDPNRYSGYRCNDLVAEWKNLRSRENELRNLIDKASEGAGGTVIGAVAYRGDYETVLAQEKVIQHAADEKHCQLVTTYGSDQSIR